MSLFTELKRRNVFRVAIAYLAASWLLTEIASTIFPMFGYGDAPAQIVVILLAIGFPLFLIFSWAYEITPEGLKREVDVVREESITHLTAKRLDGITIGLIVVALAFILVDRFVLLPFQEIQTTENSKAPAQGQGSTESQSDKLQDKSIVVLPFVNISGDPEQEYFSDGLTEEVITILSRLPQLRVTARTSSFFFKGKDMHTAQIADVLNVSHLLEGSVRREGNRVRITAQLIDAQSDTHVWSKNYDRDLGSIFAIQDDVANSIATALIDSFKGLNDKRSEHAATTDLSAYENYLKGLRKQASWSFADLDAAEGYFKQALARDPGFTDARLSLVRNYLQQVSTGLIDMDEARMATEPLLDQVREQDPDNPLARALELTRDLLDDPWGSAYDVEAAAAELQSLLLELPTETFIRTRVANLQYFFGNEQQSIELLQAGLLIDPQEADLHRLLGVSYIDTGNLEQARASLLRAIELAPGNPNHYIAMSDLEKQLDNLPVALDWLRRATQVDREDHEIAAVLARDLYQLRLPEEGDYWLARVQVLAPGSGLARSLEVERAVAREDKEEVIALASEIIADQVEDRGSAYRDSVFHYIDTMLQDGRAKEAYDFLVNVRPEITQYDQIPLDMKGLVTQWASIGAMSGFETFGNRQTAWDTFTDRLDELGFPWKLTVESIWKLTPISGGSTWNYVMHGEVEQAIDHFLGHELSEPVSSDLYLHRKPLYALFAPVYEDQRVATKLIERAERFAELREDVRAELQRPERNKP